MAKRKKKNNHIPYRGGYYWPTPEGTWQGVYYHDYQRHTRRFKFEHAARAWLDQVTCALENDMTPLNTLDTRDARRALDELPSGYSLCDAVRFFNRHHKTAGAGLTAENAVQRFLSDKIAAGLREKSIVSLRSQIRPIATLFAETPLADITPDMLSSVLMSYKGETRANYRRAWHNLFKWSVLAGHLATNPVDAITAPKVDHGAPAFLTVEQSEALLAASQTDPALVGFFATGLFAGIRVAELTRLTPDAFTADGIRIGADIAKTRQTRFVTISENLIAWLSAYPWPKRPEKNMRKRREKVLEEAALHECWPQNAMRHSFCTYHLAAHRNANLTAHEMGHSNADLLYRHYRGLTDQATAEKYWRINPQ